MIKPRLEDSMLFIHFTSQKLVAESIIQQGFKYSDSFYKTTQQISSFEIEFVYKFQLYREYGDFLMFFCIPETVFWLIQKNLWSPKNDLLMELGISLNNSDDELNYLLPPMFVLGYVDLKNQIFISNERYLEGFDINRFGINDENKKL